MSSNVAVVERVQELGETLCRERISPEELSSSLGVEVARSGSRSGSAMKIQPDDPGFSAATIAVDPHGSLFYVRLELAQPEDLSLRLLTDIFGSYSTVPRLHSGSAHRVVFHISDPNLPYTCALIAELDSGPTDRSTSAATAITLRRDPRID